ncbi:SpoIIE family protein phosphatase [Mycolicibacterium grossiae]|nr:SpoIIE family protein phosphatase [Mycolicibacterium grossiae]
MAPAGRDGKSVVGSARECCRHCLRSPVRFASTHLSPGDTLLLYTDGLTEARTGNGRHRFDEDGTELIAFTRAHGPASAAQIVDSLRRLLDGFGDGVDDNVAVLALGVS